MSIAANETQAPERRIGTEEELITLPEAARHLPGSHGKKVSKVSGPPSHEPLEPPAEPVPGVLSSPKQPCFQKSGCKSAQKARKRFIANDLPKSGDRLQGSCAMQRNKRTDMKGGSALKKS